MTASFKELIVWQKLRGSLGETETQLIIAARLGYLKKDELSTITQFLQEVGRLLNGLQRALSLKLENI